MNSLRLAAAVAVAAPLLATLGALGTPDIAWSADGPTAVSEVVVTATRSPIALENVPESVSLVTGQQIQDLPGQGLDDTLRNLPGMTLNAISPDVGHPTAYNEGMRGLPTTETRFLVLVDGVPVNDPFFGYIQWNRIPLDNIDRVEVVRGGGSPLWGNTAMGGVVNVITRAPASDELLIDVSGGSYGTYRTAVYGAYRAADWLALSANVQAKGTDGYQTTPASWSSYGSTSLRSPVYTPTSADARNASLRADVSPPGTDLKAWVEVRYSQDDQVLSTPIGVDRQHIWTYSAGLKKSFGDGAALDLVYFHDDSAFVTNNPHLLTFTTEYNSNVHVTDVSDNGASLVLSKTSDGLFRRLALGMDFHQLAGADSADYYAPNGQLAAPTIEGGGHQLFLAGFGQAEIAPITPLTILASLRYQYYRNDAGVDTFPPGFGALPTYEKFRFTPRLDVRYDLGAGFALRGAYYQAFRAPTLDQLYRTYADTTAGIYEGNPLLAPETLQGGEVGLDYNRPGLRVQATLYDTTISNLITQRNLNPSEYPNLLGVTCGYDAATYTYLSCTRNINAASALAQGLETEVDWTIGHGVSSRITYTYADSHYTSDPVDPTAVGERLEGVPMHNASASLTYASPSRWRASAILRYVSKSYGDDNPADGLIQNPHLTADVSASYRLTRALETYVQIQNLFDDRYIASNGGGAPILGTPFEAMAGLRLKLQ
jgi:outer membrane receptor protein involved in Fe transport